MNSNSTTNAGDGGGVGAGAGAGSGSGTVPGSGSAGNSKVQQPLTTSAQMSGSGAGNSGTGNSKSPPHGVYKNPRFMHVCTTVVGCTVHLQTKDGSVWDGIFATFSSEFAICLNYAVQIDSKSPDKDCLFQALKNGSKAQEKVFFDLKDIVRITVIDVDLNSAIKEMDKLTTDADISGFNPGNKPGKPRELESWQDDDGDEANDDSMLTLDDVAASNKNGSQNNRSGWGAQEMFRFNERVHKVNSTYDEELRDYTIALPKPGNKHDKDWHNKQERAAAIAKEIETNVKSQNRLAKEDGSDDEEEKFSAVVRPVLEQKVPQQHAQQSQHQSQQSHQQHQNQPPQQQHHLNQQHQQPQHHSHQPQHHHQNQHQNQQMQHQHQNRQPPHQQHQHQQQQQQQQPQQHQQPRQIPPRNPRYQRFDSLRNFSRQLIIGPTQPRRDEGGEVRRNDTLNVSSTPALTATPPKPVINPQADVPITTPKPSVNVGTPAPATPSSKPSTSASQSPAASITPSKPSSSVSSTSSTPSSELAKKSKLNPNAKEFVYKPKTVTAPVAGVVAHHPGTMPQPHMSVGQYRPILVPPHTMDPNHSSPMSQAAVAHGPYYQQVPMYGIPHHQQQPHMHPQYMPNHVHMNFQNQIHYMPNLMAPQQFAPQQVPPRYIRGNFQNYAYYHPGDDPSKWLHMYRPPSQGNGGEQQQWAGQMQPPPPQQQPQPQQDTTRFQN